MSKKQWKKQADRQTKAIKSNKVKPDPYIGEEPSIDDLYQFLIDSRIKFNLEYNSPDIEKSQSNKDDYVYLKELGKGAFGKVKLAKRKNNGELRFAVKKVKKKNQFLNEKEILRSIRFPFTVHLIDFFENDKFLYMVLPYLSGGSLCDCLDYVGKFKENDSKFYSAQTLLALEYLHFLNIVYRDLKPENILLDAKGYIKVTDFGLCKKLTSHTYTLCGTPDYIAPEVILNKGYGISADYWSFGVLLYELNSGVPPFNAEDSYQTFENIVNEKYKFLPYFSQDLKDIIKNLLQANLSKRYGVLKNGITDIKTHSWFQTINWIALLNRNIPAPVFKRPTKNT